SCLISLFSCCPDPPPLHSFPTRRSSDLALGLGMAAVADHDDLAALAQHLLDLAMHLGDQRTGGVEYPQAAALGFRLYRLRHAMRSEEHTSELQSPYDLVCRLLLEKKNIR